MMIGQIKNIRFTYQSESERVRQSRKSVGRLDGRRSDAAAQKVSSALFLGELEVAMPAITAIAVSTIGSLLRGVTGQRALKELLRRLRNRRAAGRLADLDARMLKDIGLTRSDLRDAYAEPLWRDPTDILARRASERHGRRRPAARTMVMEASEPLFAARPVRCYPPLDRSCRFLV
jgi:uncharacterized protein YjiS (DUF1127 family)